MDKGERLSEEINLLDYLEVIKNHRKLIIFIVATAVVLTAILSFLMSPIYQAKAVIIPEEKRLPITAEHFTHIAGHLLPSPKAAEIVGLLNSHIIPEKIIKKYNLLPVFFDDKKLKKLTDNEKIWEGIRYLKDKLKINYKQRDNLIEISMEFKDPEMAAKILTYTLDELTEHMASETKRVANTNRKYLESQLIQTSDPFIKTRIYNLIAQQIELSMLAEAKENFAFKIIDPPKAPDKRTKPKRVQMVAISFVVSLFFAIFLAFFDNYLKKSKKTKEEV